MSSYASGTAVSEEKSRQEIERMLQRWGATEFGVLTSWERNEAVIAFRHRAIQIRMCIPMPDKNDPRYSKTKTGKWTRSPESARQVFEGEVRRRWRCLCLALKAKMVAVEDGITTFEREFLPYMVTSDGRTIADALAPVIEHAIAGNGVISLDRQLPAGRGSRGRDNDEA